MRMVCVPTWRKNNPLTHIPLPLVSLNWYNYATNCCLTHDILLNYVSGKELVTNESILTTCQYLKDTGKFYWFPEFKRGRTSCENYRRSGWPKAITTSKMVKEFKELVLDDKKLDVEQTFGHQNSRQRWVPRLLTNE